MTAIVCIENRGGILFLKRRVSRDSAVIADIARYAEQLFLTPYSLPLFEGANIETAVSDTPIESALPNGFAFIESGEIEKKLSLISRLIIYKWNRRYPSDVKLGFEPSERGFSLCETGEFVGSSHEKITKEIYER